MGNQPEKLDVPILASASASGIGLTLQDEHELRKKTKQQPKQAIQKQLKPVKVAAAADPGDREIILEPPKLRRTRLPKATNKKKKNPALVKVPLEKKKRAEGGKKRKVAAQEVTTPEVATQVPLEEPTEAEIPAVVLKVAMQEPIIKKKRKQTIPRKNVYVRKKKSVAEEEVTATEVGTEEIEEPEVSAAKFGADEIAEQEVAAAGVGAEEVANAKTTMPKVPTEVILNKLRRKRKQHNVQENEGITAPEKKKKRKKREPTGNVVCRTSPFIMFNLIPHLNEEQKKAVRELGFGGLLLLSTEGNNLQLITYLIEKFNCNRCSFQFDNNDELKIEEEDVELIFDLPRGQKSVSETLSNKDDDQSFEELVNTWKIRWNVKKGQVAPLTRIMAEVLVHRQDSEVEFKQDFMVIAMTTLFTSLKARRANYKILKVLQDMKKVKEYNWCAFMMQSLVSTVEEYKASTAKEKYFSGPGLLMMLCYLDRMEFRIRKENSRAFPIFSNWEKSEIDKRVQKEKESGGFGQGKVVERLNRIVKTGKEDIEKEKTQKEMEKEKEMKDIEKEKMDKKEKEKTEKDKMDVGEQRDEQEKSSTAKLSMVLKKMNGAVSEFRDALEEMGKKMKFL